MLFTKENNKSLPLLQLVTTLFIMLAPFILGNADNAIYAYMLMACTGAIFVFRVYEAGRYYVSIYHFFLTVLLGYSALSLTWITNRSTHFVYMAVISSAMLILSLMIDYFSESSEEKAHRRIMYMLSVGSILCALQNCIYWLTDIVPFGTKESFSQGMGSNHFLAVFTLTGIVVTSLLIKGNSRLRKVIFAFGIALMLFVFIMCKSVFAWILLISFAVIFLSSRKSDKLFFTVSAAAIIIFTALTLLIFFSTEISSVFKGVFSYGSLFGRGGGFLSAGELYLDKLYSHTDMPGLLAVLYASSGIIGLLCAALFIAKPVVHFIKLKTWASVLNVFLTVMIMFLPFARSLTVLVLWMGIIAYNEKTGDYAAKRIFSQKADVRKKAGYIAGIIGLITVMFICQRFLVLGADFEYEKKDYMASYSLYNSASFINPFDSESAFMAAQSLYKSGSVEKFYNEAIVLVDKAHERDRDNLLCNKLKAQIHHACGRYDMAVQEYTYISSRAKVNDEYNLMLVESLYEIIQANPEGSAETVEVYDKIVEIAKNTENPDYREKINNIADKALVYTRRRTEY